MDPMIDLALEAVNGDNCCSYERTVRLVAGLAVSERQRFWTLVQALQEAASKYGEDSPAYRQYVRELRQG